MTNRDGRSFAGAARPADRRDRTPIRAIPSTSISTSPEAWSRFSTHSTRRFAAWRISSGETSIFSRPTWWTYPSAIWRRVPARRRGERASSRWRRHIREKRVRRAVIVTDGEVGGLGARDRGDPRGDDSRRRADERAGEGRRTCPPRAPPRGSPWPGALQRILAVQFSVLQTQAAQAASESDLRHAEEWLAARYPEWSKVAGPDAKSGKTAGATKKKGRS